MFQHASIVRLANSFAIEELKKYSDTDKEGGDDL